MYDVISRNNTDNSDLLTNNSHQEEISLTVLELALNMVEQNSVFLSNSDVLHSTLFCVIVAPLVDRKKSKLSRKREKEKKDIVSGLVIFIKRLHGYSCPD